MKNLKSLIILGVLVVAAAPLFAQASADITVSANVARSCQITGGAIAFGAYDVLSGAAVTASDTISVRCTKDAAGFTIDVDGGVGGDFSMTNGTDDLAYSLSIEGSPWTVGGSYTYIPANSGWTDLTVEGTITANQFVSDGAYDDTVVATINF